MRKWILPAEPAQQEVDMAKEAVCVLTMWIWFQVSLDCCSAASRSNNDPCSCDIFPS